jgi:hypothetical protein
VETLVLQQRKASRSEAVKKRDICTSYWNVATYKWKIERISLFSLKLRIKATGT